jgi:hypothetical protein
MADVPPLLSDPLHAAWGTSTRPAVASDPAGDAVGDVASLAAVDDETAWLQLSRVPFSHDGSATVLRRGTFRRRIFQPAPGGADTAVEAAGTCVLSVQLFVPDAEQQVDCRRWLDEEHAERQLAVPGARWFAGYESVDGEFNFLNLWGLDSPDVIDTVEWVDARETPWRDRLLERAIVRTERSVFAWEPVARKQLS